ncbi:MAG: DUF1489 family protein, partial [Alphaproteobacteria bacterium]
MLHLKKLCVGIDTSEHLAAVQRYRLERLAREGKAPRLAFITRNTPRRAAEILDGGGSLYWIVRGVMCVRQRIIAIEPAVDREGNRACALVFDPGLVLTRPVPSRPFQGWRYLTPAEAPRD